MSNLDKIILTSKIDFTISNFFILLCLVIYGWMGRTDTSPFWVDNTL